MNSVRTHYARWFLLATLFLSTALAADTANVAEDAHIDLGSPQDNYGVVPNLVVSNVVGRKTGERLAFVSYDLPLLPAGSSLEQALLRIYVGKVATPGDVDVYLVTEAWDEHAISGLTAPGFEATPFTTFSVADLDEGHFITIDVTPEVEAWLSGAEPNYGFSLVGNPGMDVELSFDSKENGQTSHQSELELVLGTASGGIDSDDIADGSIGSDDIADGSVGSDDIADNSVGSDDIEDGSISSSDVDSSAIQLRVSGNCAAGSSIREIGQSGAVTCEIDDDSGGDITAVNAGLFLKGGGTSGDVTLDVAPESLDSSRIQNGSISSADIDSNEVQVRVHGVCNPGFAIREIKTNGAVICEEDDNSTLNPDLFWQLGGNAGTSPIPGGPNFLGTTDETDLALGVNSSQAMRLSYYEDDYVETVNVIGGHSSNRVTARGGTIGGGGYRNTVSGVSSPNKVEAQFGTIGGGSKNAVFDPYGLIGGGGGNTLEAGGGYSVIAGGLVNTIEDDPDTPGDFFPRAFIGGGERNRIVEAGFATIAGGTDNQVRSWYAFIGGGDRNAVCSPDVFDKEELPQAFPGSGDVIVGGRLNHSCGYNSFIGGGHGNQASGELAVIVGGDNNRASGVQAVIVGGKSNRASGANSFAAGYRALAVHDGAFVWKDSTNEPVNTAYQSERPNQVRMRAAGGVRFDVGDDAGTATGGDQWVDIRTQAINTWGNDTANFRLIDTSTGAYLSLGGGWVDVSDRERKTDIRDVDKHWVLEQVAAMPIQTWRYKVEGENVRHIGPMAQDFHAFFGFGGDPKGIMSVDTNGVALVAIQALYRVMGELDRRTAQLEAQQHRLDALEASMQALEARLNPVEDQRLARVEVGLASQ